MRYTIHRNTAGFIPSSFCASSMSKYIMDPGDSGHKSDRMSPILKALNLTCLEYQKKTDQVHHVSLPASHAGFQQGLKT